MIASNYAPTDQTGNGNRRDINKGTENQIFCKQQEDVTWECGRSGSCNSWCRSTGASVGLFEMTDVELW